MFASCVTISNPHSLSSSETGVNPEIRSWKNHLSEWARCQKAVGGIYFTKKWRAETVQPGLEFDNIKPGLESGIFKCISWQNGLLFGGDDRGFLTEGVKTYHMGPMSPLSSLTFFSVLTSIVYGRNPGQSWKKKKKIKFKTWQKSTKFESNVTLRYHVNARPGRTTNGRGLRSWRFPKVQVQKEYSRPHKEWKKSMR